MRLLRTVALACSVAAPMAAQVVRGTIAERATSAPAGGVVVLLLDGGDNAVARALSGVHGDYRLSAPGAGTYRIRTLRIGFRPSTTEPFELGAGREITRDVEVAMIPFLLDTVKATGRNECRGRTGTDVASAIWEQARTALYATQISSRLPAVEATLMTYERAYNPGSTRIREQTADTKHGFTTAAWVSLSPDSLRKIGYVTEDERGWTMFYGPDVVVLLSREFQADHCFRLARSKDTTLTSVSFEPTRDRSGISDIRGTLLLDTKSSELRRLEFRYTNVSPVQEDEGAGGQIDFARMKNGGFAITRWNIRMPVVTVRNFTGRGGLGAPSGQQARLSEVRVAGGDLVAVTLDGDTLWTRPGITLVGVVTDSSSGERIPLARVSLVGTEHHTTSDPRGRFEIMDLLPGEYTLEVRTPSLDSMNAVHRAGVTVEDEMRPLTLRVARADALVKALCSFDKSWGRSSPPGVVLGTSRLVGDSVPPTNVLVAVEWTQKRLRTEGGMMTATDERRWKEVRTDAKGEFRVCGVPTGTALLLRASGDSAEAAPVQVRIPDGVRFDRAELVFDHVLARSAVFAGTVLVDSTLQPIPDVEVSLPGLKRSMLTNADGRFRFADVPAGEHQFLARRVGFGALDTKLTFAPGQTQSRKIFLTKVPMLEVVEVTASVLPREFDENRRLGLGHFMTRAELAKLEHVTLAAVVRQLPGLRLNICGRSDVVSPGNCVFTNRVTRTEEPATAANPLRIKMMCPADVYLDRLLVSKQGDPEFDINSIQVSQIEAIQWYASRMQVPAEYNTPSSICGVLVIHTRKSP